jgi:hypothetical protein
MLKTCSRSNALIALLLLVSAACLGQVMALYAPGLLGQIASSLCQVWLLALPLAWFFCRSRQVQDITAEATRVVGWNCVGTVDVRYHP